MRGYRLPHASYKNRRYAYNGWEKKFLAMRLKGFAKKFFAVVAFALLTSSAHSAKNALSQGVMIQVVQHSAGLQDLSTVSFVAEDEILSGFFNQGVIASNSPAILSTSAEEKKLWQAGFRDATDSALSSFVQVNLFFEDSATNSKLVRLGLLKKISWKVASVPAGKVFEAGAKEVVKPTDKEGEEKVRGFVKALFSHLYKVLVTMKS